MDDLIIRLRVHADAPPEFLQKTLNRQKGVKAVSPFVLPGGRVGLQVHVDGRTPVPEAESFGQELAEMVGQFAGVYEAEYEYVYSLSEREIEKVRWLGGDSPEDVVQELDGELFIRLDYYLHGLSLEDIGISDARFEQMIDDALNAWPQRAQARDGIRRVHDHFERLPAIRQIVEKRKQRQAASAEA